MKLTKLTLPLFIFVVLISLGFGATYNVNACGSYTLNPGDVLNLTANIYANPNSTITNGACLFIKTVQTSSSSGNTFYLYANNKSIIQNGSSATFGLYINYTSTVSCSSTYTSELQQANGNLEIAGFTNGVLMMHNITAAQKCVISFIGQNLTLTDISNYGVLYNFVDNASMSYNYIQSKGWIVNSTPVKFVYVNNTLNQQMLNPPSILSISTCMNMNSTIYSVYRNLTIVSDTALKGVENCKPVFSEGDVLLNTTANNFSGKTGLLLFTSNSNFYVNGNIFYSEVVRGTSGQSSAYANNGTRTISYTNASTNLWINFKEYYYTPLKNTYNVDSLYSLKLTGKFSYCFSGGYCNPLYLVNFTVPSGGFYIHGPGSVAPVRITNTYEYLWIYWQQGSAEYLVASSKNNEDKYFYLQPNGLYRMVIENGGANTTYYVMYSCPSIYSICYLTLSSESNTTYSYVVFPSSGCTANKTTNTISCWHIDATNTTNYTQFVIKKSASTICESTINSSEAYANCTLTPPENLSTYVYSYYIYRNDGVKTKLVSSGFVDMRTPTTTVQDWSLVAISLLVVAFFVGLMIHPSAGAIFAGVGFFALVILGLLPISSTTGAVVLAGSLIVGWMLGR